MPLGIWKGIEYGWQWFYSPSFDGLLRNDKGSWRFFPKIHRKAHLPTFSANGQDAYFPTPTDMCRATVYFNRSIIECTGYAPSHIPGRSSEHTLTQHLLQADVREKWCFAHMDITDEGRAIANAIAQGEAIARTYMAQWPGFLKVQMTQVNSPGR